MVARVKTDAGELERICLPPRARLTEKSCNVLKMEDETWSADSKVLTAAAVGVVAIGVGIGLEVYRRVQAPPAAAGLPPLEEALRPPAAAPASPAPLAAETAPEADDRQLLAFVSAWKEDPLARKFADDFARDSSLAALWSDFERTRDVPALARGLRASGPFGRLLERYSKESGFRRLLDGAVKVPGVAAVVEAERRGPPKKL